MKLADLKEVNNNVDLDEYLYLYNYVIDEYENERGRMVALIK